MSETETVAEPAATSSEGESPEVVSEVANQICGRALLDHRLQKAVDEFLNVRTHLRDAPGREIGCHHAAQPVVHGVVHAREDEGDVGVLVEVVAGADPVVTVGDDQRDALVSLAPKQQDGRQSLP